MVCEDAVPVCVVHRLTQTGVKTGHGHDIDSVFDQRGDEGRRMPFRIDWTLEPAIFPIDQFGWEPPAPPSGPGPHWVDPRGQPPAVGRLRSRMARRIV
jgi:hypothetical protein